MPMLVEFQQDALCAKVVIEDDGRTAYAYLLVEEQIAGDVWLYNVGPAPERPQWHDRTRMPFTNPAEFALQTPFQPAADLSEFQLHWVSGVSGLQEVQIILRGTPHAVMKPGVRPGWCRLAAKSGPLARPLTELS